MSEQEDQEDHHDRGERNHEDELLDDPFERAGAVAALQAHPTNAAFVLLGHL